MKKSFWPSAALATVFSVVLVPEVSAQYASYLVRSTHQHATVRLDPKGFVIGTIFRAGANPSALAGGFRRATGQVVSDSYWGFGSGNFDGCGWVLQSTIEQGGSTPNYCGGLQGFVPSNSTETRRYMLQWYAATINDYVEGMNLPLRNDGSPCRVVNPATGHAFWGNYRPNGPLKDYWHDLAPGRIVYWRYTTIDNVAVMIRYPYYAGDTSGAAGDSRWGFVHRNALAGVLRHSNLDGTPL